MCVRVCIYICASVGAISSFPNVTYVPNTWQYN